MDAPGRLPPARVGVARAARAEPAGSPGRGARGAADARCDGSGAAPAPALGRGLGRACGAPRTDPRGQRPSHTEEGRVSVRDHPAARRPPFLAPAVEQHGSRPDDQASPSIGLQVLLFVLAAALSGFTILREISPHDEGLMLQAGARIAAGQWPYRDFWTNYMPGQPLVLALLQQIFGPSLLAWRVVRTLTDATVALLAYRLARRRAPESYALAAWLAVAGAMAFPTGPGPNPPALALAFGALLAARRRPALGGVLAGIACLFRLEIGVAAIIGVALEAPIGARARAAAIGAGC